MKWWSSWSIQCTKCRGNNYSSCTSRSSENICDIKHARNKYTPKNTQLKDFEFFHVGNMVVQQSSAFNAPSVELIIVVVQVEAVKIYVA
jgi:hypothetical protein